MCQGGTRCAVRDTAHGCEVWTRNDVGHDVYTQLEMQNLLLDGPVPSPDGQCEIILVRWQEGDALTATNVRPLLESNPDITVVDLSALVAP